MGAIRINRNVCFVGIYTFMKGRLSVKKFLAVMLCFGLVCGMGLGLTGCQEKKTPPAKDKAATEKDKAAAEKDKAAAEKDKAAAEKDKAAAEKDKAAAEKDKK